MSFKYRIAVILLNLLSKTWYFEIKGIIPEKPAIIAFWHGTMLPVWKYFENKGSFAVVSMSKDGEILTQLLKRWKFSVLRGSSSRNGKEVLNEMTELASKGFLLITPDGPQGPIYKMKAGAVVSSIRSEVPLVLVGVIVKNKKIFNSWDKFYLPMPFTKIILQFSECNNFRKDLSKSEVNDNILKLEKVLNNLNKISD